MSVFVSYVDNVECLLKTLSRPFIFRPGQLTSFAGKTEMETKAISKTHEFRSMVTCIILLIPFAKLC